MNLAKSEEFINPKLLNENQVTIIGAGAIGGWIAELLVRQGQRKLTVYDFDRVEEHNIANQIYTRYHIAMPKTLALEEILKEIEHDVEVERKDAWKPGEPLSGVVFLALDNIDTRRAIIEDNMYNQHIKLILDHRMLLTSCQHYAADWKNPSSKEKLLKTMNFTHAEAEKNTPVTACGYTQSISPNVRLAAQLGVINYTNYLKGEEVAEAVVAEPYKFSILKIA